MRNFFFKQFIYFLGLVLFHWSELKAQDIHKTITEQEFHQKENSLLISGDSILHGSSDGIRTNANMQFTKEMESILSCQNSFSYDFDSLPSLSVLKSKDGLLKIFTWIQPSFDRNSYSYFGFIQTFDKRTRLVMLYRLEEKKYENEEAGYLILKPNAWYGALYYRILENKYKGKTIYTVLGWHGKDHKSNRKIIDVITINPTLAFGSPVFKGDGKPACRMIFEFTSNAVMKLNFDERKKIIVFDHLSPAAGAEKNQYEFYGPDFRYDAFKFKRGLWNLQKDIDLRNPKSYDVKEGKKEKGRTLYDPGM